MTLKKSIIREYSKAMRAKLKIIRLLIEKRTRASPFEKWKIDFLLKHL
jgi:hypothetical protein